MADITFRTSILENNNNPLTRTANNKLLLIILEVDADLKKIFLSVKDNNDDKQKINAIRLMKNAAMLNEFAWKGFVLKRSTETNPAEIKPIDTRLKFNIRIFYTDKLSFGHKFR